LIYRPLLEPLKNLRKTGNRRGYNLPPEKPVLKISFDEIGKYKDTFILSDRVWLFLYDLWRRMGDTEYDRFLKELFKFESVDYKRFEGLILKYLPEYKDELNIWLNTSKYPDSFSILDN